MAIIEMQDPDFGYCDWVGVMGLRVKPGYTIKAEQSLSTVESDKASMEIPSSHAGVVKELKVAVGDKVKQGSLVLMLEVAGEAAAVAAAPVAPVQEEKVAPAQANAVQAAPVSIATSSTGPVQVLVPDIGDFKDVTVIEVMVKVGDSIKVDDAICTLESDLSLIHI